MLKERYPHADVVEVDARSISGPHEQVDWAIVADDATVRFLHSIWPEVRVVLFEEWSERSELRTAPAPPKLTTRERETLGLVAEGMSNKEIGQELHLSEKTIKAHLAAVFRKLGATNRTHAVMLFQRMSASK